MTNNRVETWKLTEAKNRLSQMVNSAIHRGPQIITHHGVEVAVMIFYDEYLRLTASRAKLSEFSQRSPLTGIDIGIVRDRQDL